MTHQQHQIKLISCIIVLVLLIVLVTAEQALNKDDAAQTSPNNPQTRLEEGLPQLHPIDSIVNKVEKDPVKILTQNFAISCDVCKFVVDETEMYLREHEPEIEKKLVHLCGYLPMQYEQLCDTIVLMYGHTILEMLERYENSTTICEQQLHLCIPSKIASADSPIEINRPNSLKGTLQQAQELDKTKGSSSLRLLNQRFGDEMECTLCEMMVAWIEHFLQNNSTHHEIEHWLKSVCLRLPSSVTGTCVAMVKQYVPFIIEKLDKKFPPHRVCKDIVPMCSFKRFEPFAGALIDDPYTSTCALCKNVTKILYSKLDAEDWKDAEKVEHVLLHHVCKHMPYKYRNKCKQFVLAADPVMIMDRYYTRKDQCVKECEVDLKTDEIEMQKNQIVTFPIICACCRYLVNIVDHYITKKSTEKEIMHVVEQVCPFFPRTYRTECVTLVEKYGDSIVKILATYIFSPSTVCFLSQCCG